MIVYELFVLNKYTWNHIIMCKLFVLRILEAIAQSAGAVEYTDCTSAER